MNHRKAILSLVVALQFGVPLYFLVASPYLSRWSWQMYSREPLRDQLVLIAPDGQETQVNPRDYFGYFRREMDYADHLEAHLRRQLEPGWRIERRRQTS